MSTHPKRLRLGILVPSSNTALEPLSTRLLSSLPNITLHFSRFPVTQIALSSTALAQFSDSKILAAAQLLADAHVDIIGWSGTSAGWLGLGADRKLCEKIEEVTGTKATTSVLALCEILDLVRKENERVEFGLVTPYLDDVQAKILETFAKEGYDVKAECHLRKTVNTEFADIGEDVLDDVIDKVMGQMSEDSTRVISTFCTNLSAAQRVNYWENRYPGLIVADTVATVIWHMLKLVGQDMSEVKGWGRIFTL